MGPTDREIQLQVQNRMVEELASRHREFETLTNLLEDILFRCDEDGTITLLNDAWSRKTGWPVEECIGKNLAEYIDNYSSLFELQSGLSDENTMYCEVRIPTQYREVRTYNLRARRNCSAWYGSLTDITDHRRTVEALQESRDIEKKLSLVASRTDNLVVITDAFGCIEWVNRGFEAVTEYSLDEVRGRRPSEFLQGHDTDLTTVADMRSGLESGVGFNVEIVNYSKSRRRYWVSIDCSPVRDDTGEIVNFVAIERDISVQKLEETKLRDSEQHYRDLLESVSEPIFECDSDLNISFANAAWYGLTAKSVTRKKSSNLISFVHPEDKSSAFSVHRQALSSDSPVRRELRIKSADEHWRRVELVLSSKTNLRATKCTTITGALIDIDERWHATQAIVAAKKEAEDLSHARSRFVANMSHEIRTPLNAIIGMSSVLQEMALSAEQQSCVDVIENGGKALLSLVNDVLDLSKVDAAGVDLDLRDFSLLELCEEAVTMIASRVEEKGLKLQVSCSENVPQLIRGDSDKLRQILINLFSNSVKFTKEGSVDLHLEWLGGDEGEGILRFSVRDTGIGIPKDRIDSLFDAFTQADASITRDYGGTGLGLAICKQLAQAMGGDIFASSKHGLGSTFTLEIPTTIAETSETDGFEGSLLGVNLDARHSKLLDSLAHCFACNVEHRVSEGKTAVISLIDSRGKEVSCADISTMSVLTPGRLWSMLQSVDQVIDEAQKRSISDAGNLSILVAEDVLPNQMVIEAMLKQLGYSDVTIVDNGALALDALRQRKFDLVFLDIHMPVLDGISAAKMIRDDKSFGSPYIVVASADVSTDARDSMEIAGIDEWLAKPFTRSSLESVLSNYRALCDEALPA